MLPSFTLRQMFFLEFYPQANVMIGCLKMPKAFVFFRMRWEKTAWNIERELLWHFL
jgi:hypothetical protein